MQKMMYNTAVVAALVGLLAAPIWAQREADEDKATFSIQTRVVVAPVTVTNRNDNIVSDLAPKDFRLRDNGNLQQITEDIAVHPISMVIAVQASSEVEKMLPAIQKLGLAIHSQILGEDGEVAVLQFDSRIETLADFTSDPDKLSMALKKLKAGSAASRLNDATDEGISLLRKRPNSRRKVLLLISEPRDNSSELRPREVLTAAEMANVVIYSINISRIMAQAKVPPPASRSVLDNRPPGAVYLGLGNVETPTIQSQQAVGNWVPLIEDIYDVAKGLIVANPLEVYTTYTGGRQYGFKTQKDLGRAVFHLGEELHSQYLLTYRPTNQEEAGYHKIVVDVLNPDVKVRARNGYYWAGKNIR
jgi:VWFA-related protein